MMIQERIDYFLNLPKGTITDEEFEELKIDYFQAEKEDWYKEIKIGNQTEKNWDEAKVKQFWIFIRLHVMPHGVKYKLFDFENFIFPKVSTDEEIESFWDKDEEKKFDYSVNFTKCKFLGYVQLTGCHFLGEAYFNQTFFDSLATFTLIKFEKNVIFSAATFKDVLSMKSVKFQNKVSFNSSFFAVLGVFSNVTFNDQASFSRINLYKPTRSDSIGDLWELVFEKLLKPELEFINIDFMQKVKLSKFNVVDLKFVSCNLREVYFNSCDWTNVTQKGRLFFPNMEGERDLQDKEDLQDSENHYRQLKQNFTDRGNWELAGYAYASEMEMRKRRLLAESRIFTWLFYWFYDYFGGYTQDFVKPIKRLFFAFIIFTGIYFFIDHDLSNAFQRSIAASIPYIQIQDHIYFTSEWLILRNIQFVLSVVLLSFFVLALRKRFKL